MCLKHSKIWLKCASSNVPPQVCLLNMPPQCASSMQVLYNCSWLTFWRFILDLRTFVAKSALSRLRTLGGTFWQNLVGGGAKAFYWTGEAKVLSRMWNSSIGCISFSHCAFSSASSSFLFDTVHTCNGCICLCVSKCALKFLGPDMQNHILRICENFPYVVYSDAHLNVMHARLHTHTVWIFYFSSLCIFGDPNNIRILSFLVKPNNIRIRSFLGSRIIFVFVLGHFRETE